MVKKKVVFIKHHDSHVGLAIASSGFKKSIYLSLDGGGDLETPEIVFLGNIQILNLKTLEKMQDLKIYAVFMH